MIYTGIGSRKTPQHILDIMYTIATNLAVLGYTLRSGGANGADSAFELGCKAMDGKAEIYLPWRGFNNNPSKYYNVCAGAMTIAKEIHPAWDKLSYGAKNLHARNVYQVLGCDLQTPSDFVICYTEDGTAKGGTATAINLAKKHNIPVYNLGNPTEYRELVKMLRSL